MFAETFSVGESRPGMTAPIGQLTQLYTVLALVERMANGLCQTDRELPSENALANAFENAPGVAKRRFLHLAEEVTAVASNGAQALIQCEGDTSVPARTLAVRIQNDIERLCAIAGAR